MAYIYLIKRTGVLGYYEYDSVIVISENKKKAIDYVLKEGYTGITKDNICCEKIGVANKKQELGEIISSFNAN